MKMKKILAALAACAMAFAMFSLTAYAEGVEAEEETVGGEEISEEEGGDEEIGDEEGDEEYGDFEEADGDEGADAVADTTNPGTGNSPIALAVIPVALAAAAVVAKKAK